MEDNLASIRLYSDKTENKEIANVALKFKGVNLRDDLFKRWNF